MCTTAFSEFAVRTSGRKRQASIRFVHTVSLIGNVKFAGRLLLSVRNGHKAHGAVHVRSIQLQVKVASAVQVLNNNRFTMTRRGHTHNHDLHDGQQQAGALGLARMWVRVALAAARLRHL